MKKHCEFCHNTSNLKNQDLFDSREKGQMPTHPEVTLCDACYQLIGELRRKGKLIYAAADSADTFNSRRVRALNAVRKSRFGRHNVGKYGIQDQKRQGQLDL